MRSTLFTMLVVLLCSSFAVQAKTYRWVDEKGQMHFGDSIPAKYQRKAHYELNDSGIVVKRNAAAKTAEQRREARLLAKERKLALKMERERKQRERVLLDTYTTERDLIVARDARLDAVNSQIQLSESIIRDSNKKIESLEKRVADIQASDREVPADLFRSIENHQQQIALYNVVKTGHEKHRDVVATQFKGYIESFRALKVEQKALRDKLAAEEEERLELQY